MVYSYLIECTRTGVCKIGKSKNPSKRLVSIKTANPFVELVGISELKEEDLHKNMKSIDSKVNGLISQKILKMKSINYLNRWILFKK
jgi:hypothetical protein